MGNNFYGSREPNDPWIKLVVTCVLNELSVGGRTYTSVYYVELRMKRRGRQIRHQK